jgi:hypothetical protein
MLEDESALNLEIGDNLHYTEMPEEPNACVSVMDSGGYEQVPGLDYRIPTVQVRVRGSRGTYSTIYAKALAIQSFLLTVHGNGEIEIGGSRYFGIWAEGDVLDIGPDENGRPEVSMNFRCHRATA